MRSRIASWCWVSPGAIRIRPDLGAARGYNSSFTLSIPFLLNFAGILQYLSDIAPDPHPDPDTLRQRLGQ